MKNIFLIHSVNGNTIDSFAGSVEKFCKDNNINYYYPIFPIRAEASPESWERILDEYREKGLLNSESMVITHSIGTKFIPKYVAKNGISIDTFVSVAGFVDYVGRTDYLKDVNELFEITDDEYFECKRLIKNRYSIYSDNDKNSPIEKCEKYANKLDSNKLLVKGAGHFTSEDGITEIKELNKIMKEYSSEKHNILVTSAGFNTINNYVSDENIKKFEEISKGKKVIIIANAAPKESGNYIARENVKENFLEVGASKCEIVDLTDENLDVILEYDVMYVLGGNVTNLVILNYNPKFRDNILRFLEKGFYIGESAGSIFLSSDTKYYYDIKRDFKEKYNVNLESYAGLRLIDKYIVPHLNKANDALKEKIDTYEKENNEEITRMNDGDIIYYSL